MNCHTTSCYHCSFDDIMGVLWLLLQQHWKIRISHGFDWKIKSKACVYGNLHSEHQFINRIVFDLLVLSSGLPATLMIVLSTWSWYPEIRIFSMTVRYLSKYQWIQRHPKPAGFSIILPLLPRELIAYLTVCNSKVQSFSYICVASTVSG